MGSDLVAVPYDNGSFCRKREGKLIVVVKNVGNEATASNRNGKTYTKVSWGQGGVYGYPPNPEKETKKLAPGEKEELEFECPPDCFTPDCMFYITVDSRHELTNEKQGQVGVDPNAFDNTYNNIKKGVCLERDKPFLPDLVAMQYLDTKTYYKREGNKLKVQIKNQGSGIAGPSKTEIKFQNGAKRNEDMPEMVPGEVKEISVDIPPPHHTGNFRFKISVDVDEVVQESNKENNSQEDRFIETEQPL